MRRLSLCLKLTPAILTCLVFAPASPADPVHRFFKRDGYWHHGSGWIFPSQVAGFALGRNPSEIDGNDDVTAEYASDTKGLHRDAVLDIYNPASGAVGAKLDTAKADLQARATRGYCKLSVKEASFAIDGHPELKGVKITFTPPKKVAGCVQANLYFFPTSTWIVSVRTSAAANDKDAAKAFDAFVRKQEWNTLNSDPLLHEPPT
jgi:hypothetical protein